MSLKNITERHTMTKFIEIKEVVLYIITDLLLANVDLLVWKCPTFFMSMQIISSTIGNVV